MKKHIVFFFLITIGCANSMEEFKERAQNKSLRLLKNNLGEVSANKAATIDRFNEDRWKNCRGIVGGVGCVLMWSTVIYTYYQFKALE